MKKIEREFICDMDTCDCGNLIAKPSNWEKDCQIICTKCGARISEKNSKKLNNYENKN